MIGRTPSCNQCCSQATLQPDDGPPQPSPAHKAVDTPPPPHTPRLHHHQSQLSCVQVLGLTRRMSAKRTFLNNVMQQVEQHGEAHAKVTPYKCI